MQTLHGHMDRRNGLDPVLSCTSKPMYYMHQHLLFITPAQDLWSMRAHTQKCLGSLSEKRCFLWTAFPKSLTSMGGSCAALQVTGGKQVKASPKLLTLGAAAYGFVAPTLILPLAPLTQVYSYRGRNQWSGVVQPGHRKAGMWQSFIYSRQSGNSLGNTTSLSYAWALHNTLVLI